MKKPFTLEEKQEIKRLLDKKISLNRIAKILKRGLSSIDFHVQRHGGRDNYQIDAPCRTNLNLHIKQIKREVEKGFCISDIVKNLNLYTSSTEVSLFIRRKFITIDDFKKASMNEVCRRFNLDMPLFPKENKSTIITAENDHKIPRLTNPLEWSPGNEVPYKPGNLSPNDRIAISVDPQILQRIENLEFQIEILSDTIKELKNAKNH